MRGHSERARSTGPARRPATVDCGGNNFVDYLLVLLVPARAADHVLGYTFSLGLAPKRTAALVGLMKAAAQLGDRKKEADVRSRLEAIWHRADRKPTLQ